VTFRRALSVRLVPTLSFIFLNLPHAPFDRRLATLFGCAFGITACFAIGLGASQIPWAAFVIVGILATIVASISRHFRLPRPAGLFLIMAASIGTFATVPVQQMPRMIGFIALGAIVAVTLGAIFAWLSPARGKDEAPPLVSPTVFENLIFDPVVIGLALACSLGAALLIGIEKPYWAPISCLSVIQGVSLRALWTRPFHRTLGTIMGLGLTAILFNLPMNEWSIAATLMLLTFVIETAVARNYAFASMFTTPLAILIAEAPRHFDISPNALMEARFFDTLIGCAIGIGFGHAIHQPALRSRLIGLFPSHLRSIC
jgi:uncharacterized membrane protein YccC